MESYLGAVKETEPIVDLRSSNIYSKQELQEMAILIKCQFAAWKDCQLHSLRYGQDEAVNQDNLDWINSLSDEEYVSVAEFLMDFYSSADNSTKEKDHEYSDYQWTPKNTICDGETESHLGG